MLTAQALGINTNYAYIVGIDDLNSKCSGASFFYEVTAKFPILNIYQVQTPEQISAMDQEAKGLEYYLKARKIFEDIYLESNLRPKRWENFRPLWYYSFGEENL